ncbi:MAG: glycosyltransferase family 2 protein [Microgenomates group bacterium]
MKKILSLSAILSSAIFLFIYFPHIILIILITNLTISIIKGLLQVYFSSLKVSPLTYHYPDTEPFISIHIASHNEPPNILINTLKSISLLKYKNYEVIIADNNTKEESVWKPVQEYCKKLGDKFRFYHIENLTGFKAGALNFIKKETNPKAQYIAIIDADYEVDLDFMKEASKYFTNNDIAFVQFPQAYMNIDKVNIGLELEYQHFFQTYMNMANHFDCVMLTGTLSIFRVDILKKVDFFKNYITEDAEIGLRLNQTGYRGLYVPKVIGRGLIPYDISSYKKQKSRWALGNVQILRDSVMHVLTDKNLKIQQKIGLISQLSAWINFTILPIFTILLVAILRLVPDSEYVLMHKIVFISGFTIFLFLFLKAISFYFLYRNKYSLIKIFKAYLVHIAMGSVYSLAAIKIYFMKNFIFERTNKFINAEITINSMRDVMFEILIGFGSLILCIYHFVMGNYKISSILFVISLMYLFIFYVLKELSHTKKLSLKLFE